MGHVFILYYQKHNIFLFQNLWLIKLKIPLFKLHPSLTNYIQFTAASLLFSLHLCYNLLHYGLTNITFYDIIFIIICKLFRYLY